MAAFNSVKLIFIEVGLGLGLGLALGLRRGWAACRARC